jgi:hypothetical protein
MEACLTDYVALLFIEMQDGFTWNDCILLEHLDFALSSCTTSNRVKIIPYGTNSPLYFDRDRLLRMTVVIDREVTKLEFVNETFEKKQKSFRDKMIESLEGVESWYETIVEKADRNSRIAQTLANQLDEEFGQMESLLKGRGNE